MSDDQSTLQAASPQNEFQPRPPRKSMTAWVLLLPIVLFGTVLWVQTRETPDKTDPTDTLPVTQAPPDTVEQPATAKPATGEPLKITLFVPNDNAELEKKIVPAPDLTASEMPTAPEKSFQVKATRAIELLLQNAPDFFPGGTKLKTVSRKANLVVVDLSKEFDTAEFWQKGDSYALLATDSIANTVGAAAPSNEREKVEVQLLVDGKPLKLLGELDMTDPLKPDPKLVAQQ